MTAPWYQPLNVGKGDGTSTQFALTDAGGFAIPMPTGGAVLVSGVVTSGYTVDATGLLTFSAAPASGALITLNPGSAYTDRLWIPQDAQREIKPALFTAKFGDGYEQNTPQGLNFKPEKWTLQFRFQSRADGDAMQDFLDSYGAYQAFTWRSPRGPNPIRVLCQDWTDTSKPGAVFSLQATFRQVFGQ